MVDDKDFYLLDPTRNLHGVQVMPITLASINIYQFERKNDLKHTIMVTF